MRGEEGGREGGRKRGEGNILKTRGWVCHVLLAMNDEDNASNKNNKNNEIRRVRCGVTYMEMLEYDVVLWYHIITW